jgi:hypothetical protein
MFSNQPFGVTSYPRNTLHQELGLSDANFLLRACKVRSLLPSFQLVRSTQLCETEKAPAERHFCRVPAKNADIYRLETRTVR